MIACPGQDHCRDGAVSFGSSSRSKLDDRFRAARMSA